MALQLGYLRDALTEAGASDESARKASEEVASFENRVATLENKINLLTWMMRTLGSLILAFQIAMFLKLSVHG